MQPVKLSGIQAAFLFLLAVGITNHVIVIPILLQVAERDAWVSGLLSIPPLALWAAVLHGLMKISGRQSVFDWFRNRCGKLTAAIVTAPVALYLIAILIMTLRDTSSWTHDTYLPNTPPPVILALLLISGYFAALQGLRTIAIAAGLLLPAVVVFGVFVASANLQFKDYSYLYPVFSHGADPVLKGVVYSMGGSIELVLIMFIQQHLKRPVRYSLLLAVIVILTGLVLGPTMGSIAIFGPFEAADQRYPAFDQWRMVMIGKFINHLDFLSIYQWLAGSLIRIAFALYLFFDVLQLTERKNRGWWMALFCLFLFLFVTYSGIGDPELMRILKNYYFPVTLAFFFVYPCLLLAIMLAKRREHSHAEG
ncbi:GerAB/ArcD/ProY family transporter [Cohnella sp. CFH 77786]|uniref:GerAB/ArcD/ProY family transporter n=1 Tax=Cohnella sp. CFH 77786 TaxID=2662265 RepID=UPI001C608C06|nr:endospore germination permease [Cohnella sp. CFH 77786]MBW5448122.1 GerAB/ArcD/ProY family transporter [Cohnella sp. CFH 77786]